MWCTCFWFCSSTTVPNAKSKYHDGQKFKLFFDINDPLCPYDSPVIGKAMISDSVYKSAYNWFILNPATRLTYIFQWIDQTMVTGNKSFSLSHICSPLPYSKNHFNAQFRHGDTTDFSLSAAQNQRNWPGDNVHNHHAQLSTVLETFKMSAQQLQGVFLPLGPSSSIVVGIVPCHL